MRLCQAGSTHFQRLVSRILFLFSLYGWSPAIAQVDSLGGKIVHVYLPSDEVDSLVVRNGNLGMKKAGLHWYSTTLVGDSLSSNTGFFFSTPQMNRFLNRTGVVKTELASARFTLEDFQGKNEMWIVIDPSGPLTVAPTLLFEPPKIINVLNPWRETGARIALPEGSYKSMVTRPDRCGWFMAFLLKPSEMKLHFREIHGEEIYGTGGRGSEADFDMAAQFTAMGMPDPLGTELWLDTEIHSWLPVYPNKEGHCQFLMATTVRDFSRQHPDFEFTSLPGNFSAPGRVEKIIGMNRRPVRSSASPLINGQNIFNHFDNWWVTDSTNAMPALRSYETCVDIPLSKTGDGLWEYDSWKTSDRGFYPVDGFNRHGETTLACAEAPSGLFLSDTVPHNLNFCTEAHANFIYRKGQKFEYRGDDDIWVFINDKLVLDFGGLHTAFSDTVELDSLSLTEGQTYRWDMFQCERQPCTSNLRFKTSIHFKQLTALDTIGDPAQPGTIQIVKRVGGAGSCAGLGSGLQQVPATHLTFQLRDAEGRVVTTLTNGSHYNGFLIIAAAPPNLQTRVTVDTSKASVDLAPGQYRVVAFEPANPSILVAIPFRVGAGSALLQPRAKVHSGKKSPPFKDALGRERTGPQVRKVFRKP